MNNTNENKCIMCGSIIPEGMQVCPQCVDKTLQEEYYGK